MAKKIQLTIPEPCHENWDNMTPVDKGRFCGSCQKQVVDFSSMSDREVAQFFKKPGTGSVCGRFMQDQLNRDMEIPKKRIPWLKYFFQITLPAFLLSAKVSAQKKAGKVKVIQNERVVMTTRLIGDTIIFPDKSQEEQKRSRLEDTVILEEVVVVAMGGTIRGKVRTGFITNKTCSVPQQQLQGRLGGVIAGIKITKEDSLLKKALNYLMPPKFNVYPNPVQGGQAITVETPSDKERLLRVIITDLSGKQLLSLSQQTFKGTNRFTINTDNRWTAGIYIVQVQDEKGKLVQQQKLLIQ